MLLLQARQLLPQRAFFLFGHRHRWSLRRSHITEAKAQELLRFPQVRSRLGKKLPPIKDFGSGLLRRTCGYTVALELSLR